MSQLQLEHLYAASIYPILMEDEDIVDANAHDNDIHKNMQKAVVVDTHNIFEDHKGDWETHAYLDSTHCSQKQASLIETDVEPYENTHEACKGEVFVCRFFLLLAHDLMRYGVGFYFIGFEIDSF